jgi:hypothetical protein
MKLRNPRVKFLANNVSEGDLHNGTLEDEVNVL